MPGRRLCEYHRWPNVPELHILSIGEQLRRSGIAADRFTMGLV